MIQKNMCPNRQKEITLKTILSLFIAGCVFTSCIWGFKSSFAADKPNLLVFGKDSDSDSIPRNSRIFKRVLNSLIEELSNEGFDVYDETAITLENFKQGRNRRTDAELIDIVRSIQRPPIDVCIIFTIYVRKKKLSYTMKLNSRVEGRLLNVKTGQRLGNFEVESYQSKNVSLDCDRECLLESIGSQSKKLSQDLGDVLARKLTYIVDSGLESRGGNLPSAYTLIFNGFSGKETEQIEELFVSFSGYKSHRPISLSSRNAEYWYQTSSKSAQLNRSLWKMTRNLGIEMRLTFSGSEFRIQKINLRRNR